MRIHVISNPNTQPTAAFLLDGFCQRARLFAELCVRLGHEVVFYGVEQTDVPGVAFVPVMPEAKRVEFLQAIQGPDGTPLPYQSVPYDFNLPLYTHYNSFAGRHLQLHKRPGDVLAIINGSAHQQLWDWNPELTFLEFSIGYRGICAPYRVYQSHAWRHVVAGFTGNDAGRVFDDVIPPWFPAETFPFTARPDPYVVFCGRIVETKGIQIASEAAKAAGVHLIAMGFGNPALVTHGDFVGEVPTARRNELLSHALCAFMPTQYIEPFGNVSAEAQLCGTPVVSTDWGGFTDSVEHGRTGYRCATLGEYIQAIDLCRGLDRAYIRARAQALYSCEAADRAYTRYFARLEAVRGDAWRSVAPTLTETRELVPA